MLNCAFGISFNKSVPFVDYVRINNKDKCNQHYEFEFNDKEVKYHPIIEEAIKIKKIKKKSELYLCLQGDDLKLYYDMIHQVFKFNEKELKCVGDDSSTIYNVKIHPNLFIEEFEKINKRVDNVTKKSKLINQIPEEDKDEFKKNLNLS